MISESEAERLHGWIEAAARPREARSSVVASERGAMLEGDGDGGCPGRPGRLHPGGIGPVAV